MAWTRTPDADLPAWFPEYPGRTAFFRWQCRRAECGAVLAYMAIPVDGSAEEIKGGRMAGWLPPGYHYEDDRSLPGWAMSTRATRERRSIVGAKVTDLEPHRRHHTPGGRLFPQRLRMAMAGLPTIVYCWQCPPERASANHLPKLPLDMLRAVVAE